jgi:ABC-type proline/glycine betaine transport system permease subunit
MREHIVDIWNGVMDARYNPLRHIPDLQVRHMVMQVLAFLWSLVFGLMITLATFNRAKQAPYSFVNGYHSVNRTRAYIWSNGKKVKLDESDPGGEHE